MDASDYAPPAQQEKDISALSVSPSSAALYSANGIGRNTSNDGESIHVDATRECAANGLNLSPCQHTGRIFFPTKSSQSSAPSVANIFFVLNPLKVLGAIVGFNTIDVIDVHPRLKPRNKCQSNQPMDVRRLAHFACRYRNSWVAFRWVNSWLTFLHFPYVSTFLSPTIQAFYAHFISSDATIRRHRKALEARHHSPLIHAV